MYLMMIMKKINVSYISDDDDRDLHDIDSIGNAYDDYDEMVQRQVTKDLLLLGTH